MDKIIEKLTFFNTFMVEINDLGANDIINFLMDDLLGCGMDGFSEDYEISGSVKEYVDNFIDTYTSAVVHKSITKKDVAEILTGENEIFAILVEYNNCRNKEDILDRLMVTLEINPDDTTLRKKIKDVIFAFDGTQRIDRSYITPDNLLSNAVKEEIRGCVLSKRDICRE